MIRKDDVKWWIAEVQKHPQAAPSIVEALSERLIALDEENELLRDEIIRLERRAPGAAVDSEEVSALREKVSTLQALVNGEVSDEPCVVLLSEGLGAARVPLAQVHKLARQEQALLGKGAMLGLRRVLVARPHEEVLLLTSRGRGLKLPLSDMPLLEGSDWPAVGPALGENEWLTGAMTVAHQPRFWTIVTRRGFVRQLIRIDFDRRVERDEPLIESPFRRDVPLTIVDGDEGDLMLITRWGKEIRFAQRSIESAGSAGLELDDDDEVVAALPLRDDGAQVLVVTADGFAVRRSASQFEPRPRPGGKGKSVIQAFDVLGVFCCIPEDKLLYLTYSGKAVFASVSEIPLYTRSSKGARVYAFDRDPAVAVTLVPKL